MNKKTIIITLAMSLALIFGCSRGHERSALYAGGAMKAQMMEEAAFDMAASDASVTAARALAPAPSPAMTRMSQASEGETATPAEVGAAERKLVKNADVRIRVENLEKADASLAALMEKYDAYAASNSIQENAYYYSLRVPSPVYDIFLAEMNGMGRLLHRFENTEDVTLRYYDLEGRLETKKELLKTFQSYLGKAKTIEEILAVEARISELQYDIEGTGMQLRNLANRVDYATINLNLLGPVAAAQNRSETLGERLKRMFGGFVDFLSGVVGAIVGIVIYGIPILLLVFFFFWLLLGRIGLLKKLWRLVRAKK